MLFGPTIVRKCSACGELVEQQTFASGNTFGGRFWTDGRVIAPMLPEQPRLVKCPHCSALIWIDEQEKVGEYRPWLESTTPFPDARPHLSPTLSDYWTALARDQLDFHKERYLRIQAWWAGNDARRDHPHPPPLSEQEVANLHALASLLDETIDDDRVMKAEVMRELGRYEATMSLLSAPVSERFTQAVRTIKALTAEKDPFVHEYFP